MLTQPDDVTAAHWRTSSYSNKIDCVEVAGDLPDVVLVRDTKDRAGLVLALPRPNWAEFLMAARRGEFDR